MTLLCVTAGSVYLIRGADAHLNISSFRRALDPHGPQTCATYGICGHRADGDVLSCAETLPAPALNATGLQKLQRVCPQLAADRGSDRHFCCTEEQLDTIQRQIEVANIFLVGCPACSHNFKQLFCLLACHPDQATFTNVTVVQPAADTNATSVANVTHYVAPEFGRALFDSCKDVTYPVLNQKAMKFVGGCDSRFWFMSVRLRAGRQVSWLVLDAFVTVFWVFVGLGPCFLSLQFL